MKIKFNLKQNPLYLTLSIIFVSFMSLLGSAYAEPFVVIEYRNNDNYGIGGSDNPFALDSDYSTEHKVLSGEVLGGIIKKYYGNSGLDLRFVQLAIIAVNPKAFARANPNYLFAGPTLKLPSVRQIQNLVLGVPLDDEANAPMGRDLYFFGS